MQKIWDYIETNPLHWADDDENPLKRSKVGATRRRPYTSTNTRRAQGIPV